MKDKKFIFWTSVVTLLPILLGLFLWNRLPDEMPTHWSGSGGPDGWSTKGFAVYGLPCLMLVFHWVMIGVTFLDKENVAQHEKIMKVILGIFPALSNVMMFLLYNIALGLDVNMTRVMMPLLGVMFLVMGNYLPKCRQNSTIGIKIKWTLYNEENWNKTHRFGGKVFVLAGLGFVALTFAEGAWRFWPLTLMIATAVAPMLYSYLLYKRQVKKGTWFQSEQSKAAEKRLRRLGWVSLIAITLILALVVGVMFFGSIEYTLGDNALTVQASFWQDASVSYGDVDRIEYRETGVDGTREWGYGSARLLLGLFRNEEFGNYTRYTYTNSGACVVLFHGEDVLVLAAENDEATRALYDALTEKVG